MFRRHGAEDRVRTGYLSVGNAALNHMSFFRIGAHWWIRTTDLRVVTAALSH